MERYCKTCNKPESKHNVRHPFIAMEVASSTEENITVKGLPSSAELLQALIKQRNDRREQLRKDLTQVLNKNGAEQDSNTPDYILADMLISHLEAYNHAVGERRNWFGITEKEGSI